MSRSPPVDAEAYRLMREGRIGDALPLAERAVTGAVACLPDHGFLASILLKLGRIRDAELVVTDAARLATGSAEAYEALAYVSTELGRHERANELYRRAIGLDPHRPRAWYNLACSERSFGRLKTAAEACDRAIALDPGHYPSLLLRSELDVQSPDSNHIPDLERRLADPKLDIHGRIFLGYALAKELDDVQRFDDAFSRFAAAAKARRSQMRYDVAGDERTLERIAEVFSGRDPARHADRAEQAGSSFIFIVGLPRSGTTLVEHILTGLAGVCSNGETDNFSRALTLTAASTGVSGAAPAAAPGHAGMIERAAALDPAVVAANYAQLARRTGTCGHVIEKLPTNYLYVGAIRRALPAAKIVVVRRTALDSCFAMYRALFGDAYPFSYDFEELARYYAAYDRLMNHWLSRFGAAVHGVAYEELVLEPQRVGADLAAYCGLEWRPQAVAIEANPSVSLTASAVQVRRPIYASSAGRWRRYRRHLAPLAAALRRHGADVPDDA
jgi:tetratricopeptide (TPR) repeat protein